MSLFELINENKEWLFSGAGILVLTIIFSFIRKASKKEIQDSKQLMNIYCLVPNSVLRRQFSEQRINKLVNIDLMPRGESAKLNLCELPICQVWLCVVNHSPFSIEFESIKGELNYNGCRVSIENSDHTNISPHSTNDTVLLEGPLTGEQAIHCSRENKQPYVLLTIKARMRTSFGIFKKHSGDLRSFNITVINKRKVTA